MVSSTTRRGRAVRRVGAARDLDRAGLVDRAAGDLRAADVDPDPCMPSGRSEPPRARWAWSRDAARARRSPGLPADSARPRSPTLTKSTKSANRSMVSGLMSCTKPMSWHTGHTRHADSCCPPRVIRHPAEGRARTSADPGAGRARSSGRACIAGAQLAGEQSRSAAASSATDPAARRGRAPRGSRQPSTRFFSSFRAVSMMAFSALRLSIPIIGIFRVTASR